jgi:hypothetical protein
MKALLASCLCDISHRSTSLCATPSLLDHLLSPTTGAVTPAAVVTLSAQVNE